MARDEDDIKPVARNRKARYDYVIEDTFEAGMVLVGTEVKSLRNGACTIAQAYARPRGDELFLYGMHIPPYEQAGMMNHEEQRPRKLLLHRREIGVIAALCAEQGYTIIPLSVYFRNGLAKVQIGIARRRRKWDKRRQKEARQQRKDARRELGRRAR